MYCEIDHFSILFPLDNVKGKKLHWLEVSGSGLRGTIPTEIGNLPKLTHLNLSRNYLDGAIPPSLGNLILLQSLVISSNIVQGSIPSLIQDLIIPGVSA